MTTGYEFLSEREGKAVLKRPTHPTHPEDVVGHPGLSVAEKRAMLASWASDTRAIPGIPLLRQLDDGSIVIVDDILRFSEDTGRRVKRQGSKTASHAVGSAL